MARYKKCMYSGCGEKASHEYANFKSKRPVVWFCHNHAECPGVDAIFKGDYEFRKIGRKRQIIIDKNQTTMHGAKTKAGSSYE